MLRKSCLVAGHLWYSFLDTKVCPDKPKSNKAVLAKMLADQLLWAPFFSCVFFAVIKTLEVSLHSVHPAKYAAFNPHGLLSKSPVG